MIQTNSFNVQPGEIFTFRNKNGNEWLAYVRRVTDKSVFHARSQDGSYEMRESLNTFNGYIVRGLVSRKESTNVS